MRVFFLAAVLGFSTVGSAAGQNECLEQVIMPEVGRWAEYKAQYQNDPSSIRYSVIGTEARSGKDFRWVELRMTGNRKDRNVIYQMLVPESVNEVGQVQEVVFKPGEQPAMKLSGQMLGMVRGQLEKQSFLEQ